MMEAGVAWAAMSDTPPMTWSDDITAPSQRLSLASACLDFRSKSGVLLSSQSLDSEQPIMHLMAIKSSSLGRG